MPRVLGRSCFVCPGPRRRQTAPMLPGSGSVRLRQSHEPDRVAHHLLTTTKSGASPVRLRVRTLHEPTSLRTAAAQQHVHQHRTLAARQRYYIERSTRNIPSPRLNVNHNLVSRVKYIGTFPCYSNARMRASDVRYTAHLIHTMGIGRCQVEFEAGGRICAQNAAKLGRTTVCISTGKSGRASAAYRTRN